MKTILVPVDFSPASRNASEYAALLAKAADADLYLLHVYKDLIPATVGPEPWSIQVSDLRSRNETRIAHEIQFLKEKYSVKVKGEIINGFKGDSIEKISREKAADLIVMGIRSGKLNRIPGRTSLKMIRKANIPVLMIPEEFIFRPLKNIVLAVNFNEMSDGASLTPLFSIMKMFDVSLRVLHIEKKGTDINEDEMPEKLQLGKDLAAVSYLYDRVENNEVDQGILQFVRDHPADMLVMITHEQGIFEQLFGSTHTRSVSLDIEVPLLVLKKAE